MGVRSHEPTSNEKFSHFTACEIKPRIPRPLAIAVAVGRTNGREQIDAAPDENGKGDRRLKRAELPGKREAEDGNSGVLRGGTRV